MRLLLALIALQAPADTNDGTTRLHAARVHALCPSDLRDDAGRLLALERSQAEVISQRPTPKGWTDLACTRALLELAGTVGREGPAMPLGDPWALGAVNAATEAIALDSTNARASELLALMALAEEADDVNDDVIATVIAAASRGGAPPPLLRACSEFAIRVGDTTNAVRCAQAGLAGGTDSTWHLIRLARVAFARHDTTGGAAAFAVAAAQVRDAVGRNEIDWHLRWFLTPAELEAWRRVPGDSAGAWVTDRLAARDVLDGKPRGARIAEHFKRLEVALRDFRLHLPRHVRRKGGLVSSTPERDKPSTIEELLTACEPGTVPALSYRYYDRWQSVIDDRGAVWMRYGAPDRRIENSPQCPGGMPAPTVREIWKYVIDGEPLLLHFENERFDGSASASRLVIGVLGTYMCDVDVVRCVMSGRTSMPGGLPPERLEAARVQDQEVVALVTGSDDNSIRGLRNIRVAARLHRLSDPYNDLPLAMVSYAVRLGDLDRPDGAGTLALDLTLRWWDPATNRARDTTFTRFHTVAAGDDSTKSMIGFVAIRGSDGITAWSLVAAQPERRGRATGRDEPPLGAAPVRMSDLVVGSEGGGLTWDLRGEMLPVAAAGQVERNRIVTLYYQVQADRAAEAVFTTISMTALDAARATGRPDLEVRSPSSFAAGLNEFATQLDVTMLQPGRYRLEVRIATGRDTTPLTRRLTTLTIE